MRHRHRGLSTYGLNGRRQGDEHPRLFPFGGVAPFTLPVHLMLPAEGVSLGIGYRRSGSGKKTRVMGQPSGYNTRTWQTDRRTDTGRQQRRIVSRGKKCLLVVQKLRGRRHSFWQVSVGTLTVMCMISRPWSQDASALEFILSRSRSWSRDLKAQIVLVSRPEVLQGLSLGLETWRPRSQSRSQYLKT